MVELPLLSTVLHSAMPACTTEPQQWQRCAVLWQSPQAPLQLALRPADSSPNHIHRNGWMTMRFKGNFV